MRGRVSVQTSGNVANVIAAVELLSNKKGRVALSRAVNHATGKTITQVRRALVAQTGLKYGAIKQATQQYSSNAGNLQAEIKGTGKYTSLKEFGARQTSRGVSAAPWGRRVVFPGTFIVAKRGGDVYKRVGMGKSFRLGKEFGYSELPIKKLYGPAVPKEMVKDQSKAAFYKTVATDLPKRVEHEMARLLGK